MDPVIRRMMVSVFISLRFSESKSDFRNASKSSGRSNFQRSSQESGKMLMVLLLVFIVLLWSSPGMSILGLWKVSVLTYLHVGRTP